MICHIGRHEGYRFFILCFCIASINCILIEKTVQDFCSSSLYEPNIEPGETFKLVLKSEALSIAHSKVWAKSKRICKHIFKTSDGAAHFVVSITNLSIPFCNNCGCDYIEISASGHNRQRYCGNKEIASFSSKADKLEIEFHYGLSTKQFDATLTLTVERNSYFITGIPKLGGSSGGSYIETPFFPDPYPANYRAEYILQSNDLDGHVLLLFLDFQISHQSFIEISGNNGTHPSRYYGNTFRPPAFVSQLNRLSFKFVSNDDQQGRPGFRAIVSFVKHVDSFAFPHTDCSGSREGRGGVISIKTYDAFSLYDCVWHILPFTPFTKLNRSISTKIQNIGHKSVLELRNGLDSKSKIIQEINCESKKYNCSNLQFETIVSASENIYIRFNGYIDSQSIVDISYSIYHMGDCSSNEFSCTDGRCFLKDFRCDGIQHCPNGTDEELCPFEDIMKNEVTLYPNVQPEKLQDEGVYKFLIFVLLGGFGLLAIVITVGYITYSYCKRRVPEPVLPEEMSGIQPPFHSVNACNNDDPPSYEDYIKSSEIYPPLFYTRPNQRFIPRDSCMQCTTSFCTGSRIRHHSAGSFNIGSSATEQGGMFGNIAADDNHHSTSATYNVEVIQNNLSFKRPKNSVHRCYSLDSNLNNLVQQESCHLLLSIVHPQCVSNEHPQVLCRTLPSDYKMRPFQKGQNKSRPQAVFSPLNTISNNNLSMNRRLTWSFVPRGSVRSDITVVVKTRCFSDPYSGISVQCSLY